MDSILGIIFLIGLSNSNYCQIINTSFETEDGQFSTQGWINWDGTPSDDTPQEGGVWSLELFGGDIWRSCFQHIPKAQNGDIYEIDCWAKKPTFMLGET
ncbi:MAG: hypothetical protein KKD86_16385 [Bacteroidetes bacterium]|nr:hypothetical protein [Bacteroidota bacterium]